MKVAYHKFWSLPLSRDMELKTYGQQGKPMIVFPSGGGRFYEFEDFGMIAAIQDFIEREQLVVYAVDSVDNESWLAHGKYPSDRGWRHSQYEQYIMEEVTPLVREHSGWTDKFIAAGCSMGGYHAANFFFKHPDVFDTTIALSGLYSPEYFVGDYMDDYVYYNFPLVYLPHMTDPGSLAQYRRSRIILCAGQGAWEEDCLRETRALEAVLKSLEIPARVDYWGEDVNHDWAWWQKQLPYFLEALAL